MATRAFHSIGIVDSSELYMLFSCAASLHGKLRFGDNLEDEWFVVYMLFEVSRRFPNLSVRVWDTDGKFLLIEAAFHLPRWIDPENSENRVFVRGGDLHIVPRDKLQNPSLIDSLRFLVKSEEKCRASEKVQSAVKNRIGEYPERARKNVHHVRVRVPVSVAQVLKNEPCLISLAVEGFYDRDIDTMKYAAKMEKFLPKGKGEELVLVWVKMSRAMYAQLWQQTFQAPKCYPMPARSDGVTYAEAELGMKIACGFEMMYQLRRKGGMEGKGSSWDAFRESLERSGYFEGLLPGSQEYKRLMENAEAYYRNSSLFSRSSEMMSAPVRRIDEILALPCSVEAFSALEVPPSDEDSWLYNGEEELNAALLEREKEMELYNKENKEKSKDLFEEGSSGNNANKWKMEQFKHLEEAHEKLKHEFQTSSKDWEVARSRLVDEVAELKARLDTQTRISNDFQMRLEITELKMELEKCRSSLMQLKVENEETSHMLSAYQKGFVELQMKMEFDKAEMERLEEDGEDKVRKLSSQLDEAKKDISRMQEELQAEREKSSGTSGSLKFSEDHRLDLLEEVMLTEMSENERKLKIE